MECRGRIAVVDLAVVPQRHFLTLSESLRLDHHVPALLDDGQQILDRAVSGRDAQGAGHTTFFVPALKTPPLARDAPVGGHRTLQPRAADSVVMGTPRPTPAAQADAVLERLHEEHPDATIALEYDSRLDLLVAVVLSAQCTDERVNAVTDDLFDQYQSPTDYATVDREQLANDIGSITYPNQKAGYIQEACRRILEEHDGDVPDTMDALTDLHGIGRKTANVILQFGHETVEGVVVDTHVQRLTRRLGLTESTDPEAIERDLMQVLEEADWQAWADLLIAHGRVVCTARDPDCEDCVLADLCPSERGDGGVDLASNEPWD